MQRLESRFVGQLVPGGELVVDRIFPALRPIDDRRSFEASLWRWAALHWSIPVSSGYGRRMRFLVVDRGHQDRVIGIIGLADPVFALKARDRWIGWDEPRRKVALTNVLDAFALGAVPPYSHLCGGKLAALLATSIEVRDLFAEKYGHRTSLISERAANPKLALVSTSSALGRSSMYNRITRPDGTLAFRSVGYTAGSGDFHFSGSIYGLLAEFARQNGLDQVHQRHPRWTGFHTGSPRSRRAVVECALRALGYNPKLLRVHGVRREVFVAPLMSNARDFLSGTGTEAWQTLPADELSVWWHQRWASRRACTQVAAINSFNPASWRLW